LEENEILIILPHESANIKHQVVGVGEFKGVRVIDNSEILRRQELLIELGGADVLMMRGSNFLFSLE
jgi:hypothetical protein